MTQGISTSDRELTAKESPGPLGRARRAGLGGSPKGKGALEGALGGGGGPWPAALVFNTATHGEVLGAGR
jgi:hypothetical protein